ncbi:hypothetical protein W97_07659 [Coniosporium apollinis CBS 100218]|uniref:Uncharacterized protein n=1 Tax=Coniosporium apollinis (strain CBS 100218) TaxID=1168221 RepID=R7Z337_CONA1|nr:uncharacterized protein W97_07659 [Coniosporium apollinis CBS 100218]EON68449.1 hypothetical protein W97_07659 [Coniosporium apollinis CBS 100218]
MTNQARHVVLFSLLAILTVPGYANDKDTRERNRFKPHVGNFPIPFHDDRLDGKVAQIEANQTLRENLDTLSWSAFYYWVDNFDPNSTFEATELQALARRDLPGDDFRHHSSLLEQANATYFEQLKGFSFNETALFNDSFDDLAINYVDAVENFSISTFYYTLGAYMGVGKSVECSSHINEVLTVTDEWEKLGSSAATTLMALLPTFLAFGNLYVPRSSEAFATSWLIGLGAAIYSFGLPVRSKNAVPSKRVVQLSSFGITLLNRIGSYGTEECKASLDELKRWTQSTGSAQYVEQFGTIRAHVELFGKRWHWWHIPAVLIAAAQAAMFAWAVQPLLAAPGVPRFMFACAHRNWTGSYLAISAVVNAIFRLLMWHAADHEVAKVFSLSGSSKDSLQAMVDRNPTVTTNKRSVPIPTTASKLPPLYPPFVSSIIMFFGRALPLGWLGCEPDDHPLRGTMKDLIKANFIFLRSVLTKPLDLVKSGFATTKSARRWRPLVILIHLSTEGRPQLRTLLTGFVEAALLLVLTFFFASQWGGNLYITTWAIGLLLVFITLGRALALIYVYLSAQTWGLHVINCDDSDEVRGCMRIICSMQEVLVICNGASYFNGHRLDFIGEDFKRWKEQYDRGEFDEEDSLDCGFAAESQFDDAGWRAWQIEYTLALFVSQAVIAEQRKRR